MCSSGASTWAASTVVQVEVLHLGLVEQVHRPLPGLVAPTGDASHGGCRLDVHALDDVVGPSTVSITDRLTGVVGASSPPVDEDPTGSVMPVR